MTNQDKCNCKEEHFKLLKRIEKLENQKTKKKALSEATLHRIIFWGAVASALHALISLATLITSWFRH